MPSSIQQIIRIENFGPNSVAMPSIQFERSKSEAGEASTEGSSVGLITAPPVVEEEKASELPSLPNTARVSSNVKFTVTIAEGVDVPWDCRLVDNNLYVDVPVNLPSYGSKESFVALLEYVETTLEADHVVVRLLKKQTGLAEAVKLFMFFGFAPVPPGHKLLAALPNVDQFLSLAYEVN